jgi:hypothetical protein
VARLVKCEVYSMFWLVDLSERRHLGDLVLNGIDNIKTDSQVIDWFYQWIADGQDRDRWWS